MSEFLIKNIWLRNHIW